MLKSMFFVLGLMLMVGCGAQSNPTQQDGGSSSDTVAATDTTEVEQIDEIPVMEPVTPVEVPVDDTVQVDESILPKNISIDIPDILKPSAVAETNQSTDQNLTPAATTPAQNDLGYEQLKADIAKVDDVVKIAQVNLIFLEKVMPTVLDRCEGMISCLFEEGQLAVVMDNRTISAIDTVLGELNTTSFDLNESVKLGQIGLTKYDTNRTYQYKLTLDMLLAEEKKVATVLNEYQSFQWSEDNSEVVTTYVYEDNESVTSIALHYLTDENGKEIMHVYDTSSDKKANIKENTSLILATNPDQNNSLNLSSNSILKSENNETNTSSFSSNVKVSEEGSLFLFSGSVSNELSGSEIETSSEVSCDNNSSCRDNQGEESNVTTTLSNEVKLYELKIMGGELLEGDYVLLPPDTTIEALTLLDIFDLSLGSFTVFEDRKQGALHDDAFLYMLSDLVIVAIDTTHESTELFKIVEKKSYPTFRIIKY